jgi:hypothetical protein
MPQILIHSNEPLWIDYGIFPRLPHEGEDIYCDSLTFRMGYGYKLARKLNAFSIEVGWCLQYAEPVFQALAKSEAQLDGISDSLIEITPTHPTALAISAPLQSGGNRTVMAGTTCDLNIAWLTESEQCPSWLVLWDWKVNDRLSEVFAWCQKMNTPVFLGVTQSENTNGYIEKLVNLLKDTPIVEGIVFHHPPYVQAKEGELDNSLVELLQKYIPVIIVKQNDELRIISFNDSILDEKVNGCFIEWLSRYIHQRFHGKDIASSVVYAQNSFR